MKNINKNKFLFIFLFLAVIIAGCNTGGNGLSAQADNSNNDDHVVINPPPGLTQHPPTVPKIKSATASTGPKVDLSWSDESPYEDGFIVKRDGSEVGRTDKNIAVWTDTQVSPGKTYCYAIVAYNKEWITVPSPEQCVTIPIPNHPPTISSVLATPASVETGKQSSMSCQASDQDGDSLIYSWSGVGTFTGSGFTVNWTVPAIVGTYTIQCSVSDGKGGIATGTTDITVVVPTPPKWTLPQSVQIRSLAVDQATGELYVAGMTYGSFPGFTNAGASDVFLAKLNPDGTIVWAKQWGTAGYDFNWDLKIFARNVFLLWSKNDPYGIGGGERVISKFDEQGNEILTVIIGDYALYHIAIDDTGVYLGILRKLDHSGALLWLPPSSPDYSNIIAMDVFVRDNTVYFVGRWIVTPTNPPKIFTVALNSATGNSVWVAEWWTGNLAESNNAFAVTVNISGIYTGGWWGDDSLTPPDQGGGSNPARCLVLRYDLSGNLLWAHQDSRVGYFHHVISDNDAVYALGCGGLTKITNDGALAWQTSVVGRSFAIFNNVLFVANDSNIILRYDALTGKQIQ